MRTQHPQVLSAPALVVSADTILRGGGVLIRRGQVERVLEGRGAVERLASRESVRWTELERGVLTPGLVNAHAHLELSSLAGRVSAEGGFLPWVGRLLQLRAQSTPAELEQGLQRAVQGLLESGTTAVGDIDSTGSVHSLEPNPLTIVAYRQVLDAGDAGRTAAALASVAHPLEVRSGVVEGLSPHAPFSVSEGLAAELARIARRRGLPLAIHWAETSEEERFLREGGGPYATAVRTQPGRSGLERLEAAGLLGPSTALVHGNAPGPGELELVARRGCTVVHCPGSHAFFDRDPFPVRSYVEAGIPLALGTDSAASNDDLDMRREMSLAAELAPAPEVWRMATENGARALGQAGRAGRLEPGWRADICAFDLEAESSPEGILDALVRSRPEVLGVWRGEDRPVGKEGPGPA